MVNILQKADLSAADFDNANTLVTGGVTIKPKHKVPAGGTAGQVLTADATGGRIWTTPAAAGTNATNLGYTPAPGKGTVTSDTGADAVLPLASLTNAGLAPPRSGTADKFLNGTGTYSALPVATPVVSGIVELAPASEYPSAADDEAATPAYVKAAIKPIAPCTATPAKLAEVAAMAADPSTFKVTVCYNDGTPSPVSVDGDDLIGMLGGGFVAGPGVKQVNFLGPVLPFYTFSNNNFEFLRSGWPYSSITVPAGATHVAFISPDEVTGGGGQVVGEGSLVKIYAAAPGDVFAIAGNQLTKNGSTTYATGQVTSPMVYTDYPWVPGHAGTDGLGPGGDAHSIAVLLCPVSLA